MPIEIKELHIKADIHPQAKGTAKQAIPDAQVLEKLKQQIKRELLQELKQQLRQINQER